MAKDAMGDLIKKAKEEFQELCEKQEANMPCRNSENMEAEKRAMLRWEKVSVLEENFLKQKSKLHWLKVGDKNNKVFQCAAMIREIKNAIKELKCRDGRVVATREEIEVEAEDFFQRISAA